MICLKCFPITNYFLGCYRLKWGAVSIAIYYIIYSQYTNSWLLWNPCFVDVLCDLCPISNVFWHIVTVWAIAYLLIQLTAFLFLMAIFMEIRSIKHCFLYLIFYGALVLPVVTYILILIVTPILYGFVCFNGPRYGFCIYMALVTVALTLYFITILNSYLLQCDVFAETPITDSMFTKLMKKIRFKIKMCRRKTPKPDPECRPDPDGECRDRCQYYKPRL